MPSEATAVINRTIAGERLRRRASFGRPRATGFVGDGKKDPPIVFSTVIEPGGHLRVVGTETVEVITCPARGLRL